MGNQEDRLGLWDSRSLEEGSHGDATRISGEEALPSWCGTSERHRGRFCERRDTGARCHHCQGDARVTKQSRQEASALSPLPAVRAPLAPLAAEAGRERPQRRNGLRRVTTASRSCVWSPLEALPLLSFPTASGQRIGGGRGWGAQGQRFRGKPE